MAAHCLPDTSITVLLACLGQDTHEKEILISARFTWLNKGEIKKKRGRDFCLRNERIKCSFINVQGVPTVKGK